MVHQMFNVLKAGKDEIESFDDDGDDADDDNDDEFDGTTGDEDEW
jgi:hypothetical protein